MKITFAEKICKIVGGYYEHYYSDCGTILLIDIHTTKCIVFEDDLKKVRKILGGNKAHIQYISIRNNRLVIECAVYA